jgi:PIN domain nuclease of toxin-antitoxin system
VRLLLDSQAVIYAVDAPGRLSAAAKTAIEDPANDLFLSAATIWEISIKVGLKKLTLSLPIRAWMNQAIVDLGLTLLPITVDYADSQAYLPDHHRDPFDRLLIAQAMVDGISIVSADPMFDKYNVNRLW